MWTAKAHSHGVTDGNEGPFIGAWKNGDFCYKASWSLDESCSCPIILWPEQRRTLSVHFETLYENI